MADRSCVADWPVRRFRPEGTGFRPGRELFRYDEKTGLFVQDDGHEGLAFVGQAGQTPNGYSGAPTAWHLDPPQRQNVAGVCGDHVILREPVTRDAIAAGVHWGPYYPDYDDHPNVRAGKAAMGFCCQVYRCANGRSTRMHDRTDPAGCDLCREDGRGHRILACTSHLDRLRNLMDHARQERDDLQKSIAFNASQQADLAGAIREAMKLLDSLVNQRNV